MFFIETRYFKDEHFNKQLVVEENSVMIQGRDEEDIILEEWTIPFTSTEKFEVCFKIDEQVFEMIKQDYIIIIYQDHIENTFMSYEFVRDDFVLWETHVPKVTCVMKIPKLVKFENDVVQVEVCENIFKITDDKKKYFFQILKSFENHSKLSVISECLNFIFEKHVDKVCKLYIHEESPLCIEFFDGHKIFVAPIL